MGDTTSSRSLDDAGRERKETGNATANHINKENRIIRSIHTYLNFPGNTEEVFNFYKSVFGVEFQSFQRFKDTPVAGEIPEKDRDKVMHVALPLGKNNFLMATDALESLGQQVTFGNNYYITIEPESKEEADRLFNALSAGGKVEMPMQDMFWGAYYGSFRDKFGVQWMINFDTHQK